MGLILCFFAFPGYVFAGLILDAELRLQYEDNVVGLLSDQQKGGVSAGAGMSPGTAMLASSMGGGKNRYTGPGSGSTRSPGDFSATLSGEAGGYRDVGSDAEVFAKGFASHTSYDTYTDLNSNIGGVSTGISVILSDLLSTRMAVLGKIKRFDDSQRDSTAYAGNLSLKEKLNSSFWLREYGQYEKNSADTSVFSYTGTTIGMEAGYAVMKNTRATLGYSYLVQTYDEPSGAEMKTQTVYVSAEHMVRKHWAVSGEYDLQVSNENSTGTSATDNILSLALRYSY